jgi:hypothetical protein
MIVSRTESDRVGPTESDRVSESAPPLRGLLTQLTRRVRVVLVRVILGPTQRWQQ